MGLLDNGLLGAGSQLANEVGQSTEAANANGDAFRKPLTVSRFDEFGHDSLSEGDKVELSRVRTPAGIERRWGYGRADREANQGYSYGHLKNGAGENIHGILSYEWENSTGRRTEVSTELASDDMATSDRYDRDTQPPMPEAQDKEKAEQDEFLVVYFTPETPAADITNAYAIDAGASEVRWPTTEYDVSA